VGEERTAVGFVWVAILTVAITLVFWLLTPAQFASNEASDYTERYSPVARNLVAGHGYRQIKGAIETRLTPGFPVSLAGVLWLSHAMGVSEHTGLVAFTLFCAVAAVGMIYLMACLIWPPRLAFLAALVWLTYPLALWLTKQPNSEIPFLPVFFGATYLLLRVLLRPEGPTFLYFMTGVMSGLAMLVRPIALGLPAVAIILLLLTRRAQSLGRTLVLCSVLAAGSLVAVLPWELWLYSVTGNVVLLSTAGPSGIRDGLTFAVGAYGQHADRVPADVRDVMETVRRSFEDRPTTSGLAAVLWEEMRRDPIPVLKLLGLKLIRSWFGTDSQRLEGPIVLIQIAYLSLVVAATVVCWRRRGRMRILSLAVWATTLYFWAMTWTSMSIVRYMVPVMGLLFLLIPALMARFSAFTHRPEGALRDGRIA
jgi:4-amino-4-deoxy-L-arabinose transferase-like glycosyltransferase